MKLKDLEWLRLALERKTETEIDEFKKNYEREREIERRHFDQWKRQLEEDTYMFNLQKERLIKAEEERNRLDIEYTKLKQERDKMTIDIS